MNTFSPHRGSMLIDALIGLSLAFIFIALITHVSIDMRRQFDMYHARKIALSDYLQYGVQSAYASSSSEQYGNERIDETTTLSISYGKRTTHVDVHHIQALSTNLDDVAGSSLCEARLVDESISSTTPHIVPIMLPINTNNLTHLEIRNDIAYISADSSVQSNPDVFIIDIHDPSHATLLSSINTGPGLSSFTIAKDRIYAAARSSAAQLHIIKMNSLSSLSLEKKVTLPLPEASTTPTKGSSVAYHRGTIFIATDKWDGTELNVIDVSNPAQPVYRGGFEIGVKVLDIKAVSDTLALATAGEKQLISLDIHDSSHPTEQRYWSPSGWSRQEGKVVDMFESIFGFGRTSGGFNITNDHEVFVLDPHISSVSTSSDYGGGIYGIVVDKDRLYMITHRLDREFVSIDRSLATSTEHTYSLPILPVSLSCDGSSLYVLAQSSPVIYAIHY